MEANRGPNLRSLWLGQQLRKLREGAGYTLREAGDYIQRDQSTLSRMESGAIPARVPDALTLLNLYGVDDPALRDAIERLSRDVWQKGWWEGYASHVAGSLMDLSWLEERAGEISWFDPLVMPGLLQTRAYAEAVMATATPSATVDQIARWVEFRMTRQRVLDAEEPLRLSVVLDESVLRRPLGGAEVMRPQLRHLWECTQRPTIEVRILPLDVATYPSPDGSFRLMHMPDPYPDVAHLDTPAGSIYVEADDVNRLKQTYDRLQQQALPPHESAELIAAATDDV